MSDITIIMPSYNKEKYISEALNSVFMQETSYDYHIIVADDCSEDRTVEIVKEYQKKYPDKITLLTSDKNLKLFKNVLRAYEITKTDYFCVLDPDDYWTDKQKIQKALDFLEKNKEYTIYVTDTIALLKDGTTKKYLHRKKAVNSTFKNFLNNNAELGCTLGSIYRNVIFKNGIPEKLRNPISDTAERSFRGDGFRNAIHIERGKAHCSAETDAVYRITEEGLWQGIKSAEQNIINANLYKDLWLFFDKKYNELLITSYFHSNKAKRAFAENFTEMDKAETEKVVTMIKKLDTIYEENKEFIDKNKYKGIKFKYIAMLKLYKILNKKLQKTGLI